MMAGMVFTCMGKYEIPTPIHTFSMLYKLIESIDRLATLEHDV